MFGVYFLYFCVTAYFKPEYIGLIFHFFNTNNNINYFFIDTENKLIPLGLRSGWPNEMINHIFTSVLPKRAIMITFGVFLIAHGH